MIDEYKIKQVYEVLMTPIVCTEYSNGKVQISKNEKTINSTQTYYRYKNWDISLDADMSDFAVGFYEIIYKCILGENKMLKADDDLFDEELAGDTLNGFNFIANLFPEAGRSSKNRTPKSKWPPILQGWEQQYHCLANFWIIPLKIGRKNNHELSKGFYNNDVNDYVDRFMDLMSSQSNFNRVFSKKYKSINEFAKKQFLYGSYMYGDLSIVRFSNETEKPEYMLTRIIDRLKIRATAIANSDYGDELWEYFHKWNLV